MANQEETLQVIKEATAILTYIKDHYPQVFQKAYESLEVKPDEK
jgi:hypothetical protein